MATPTIKQRYIDDLKFSHQVLSKALEDFTDQNATKQSGAIVNHALWTYGHIAVSNAWFRSLLDGVMTPLPDSYNGLFGMGSTPTDEPAKYPSLAEVKKHFAESLEALIAAVERSSEEDLAKPSLGDSGGMAPDRFAAVNRAGWHAAWHLGQITMLRRAMGFKPMF
jgi:hypothetical protein